MKIYCENDMIWRRGIPYLRRGMTLPCVVLEKDNWDDFGYTTSFKAAVFNKSRVRVHYGEIKVLHGKNKDIELPAEFERLPENYCSLWQGIGDYKVLNELEFGKEILGALNDVNYDQIIRDKFSDHPGLNNSLRRFSDAEKAYQEGIKILNNTMDISDFSFRYIEGNDSPTPFGLLSFNFSRKLLGMYRIIGIIGRNGVGKTTLLANLASVLSGVQKKAASLSPRPPVSKVIAISYSTFDDFYRPPLDERTFSYTYCGIRGEYDLLNQMEINELFRVNFKALEKKGRTELWNTCMNILYLNRLEDNLPSDEPILRSFKRLSSGQKIMTLSFTQIINTIEQNSLLLFDEPETHLHPNGQNTLFKCLDLILNQFDSYSIISTHSPIFIQNIPHNNVFKINSSNGVRTVQPLNIESFGQHFSKLTEEIFGFSENNLFYVEKIKMILNKREELGNEFEEIHLLNSSGVKYNLANLEND
jgi:predicted ATPase